MIWAKLALRVFFYLLGWRIYKLPFIAFFFFCLVFFFIYGLNILLRRTYSLGVCASVCQRLDARSAFGIGLKISRRFMNSHHFLHR